MDDITDTPVHDENPDPMEAVEEEFLDKEALLRSSTDDEDTRATEDKPEPLAPKRR